MTAPSTAEDASMAGGEGWREREKDLAWLDRQRAVGHCGESTSEAIARGRLDDRINRILAALRTPADPRPDLLEALREARFLEARLSEFENEDLSEEAARAWMGHVHPSLSRLRQALAKINAVTGEAG